MESTAQYRHITEANINYYTEKRNLVKKLQNVSTRCKCKNTQMSQKHSAKGSYSILARFSWVTSTIVVEHKQG